MLGLVRNKWTVLPRVWQQKRINDGLWMLKKKIVKITRKDVSLHYMYKTLRVTSLFHH